MMKIKSSRARRPIIADVLMIITAMVMAVLVFVLAYQLLWSVTEIPHVNLMIEDAKAGSSDITIVHMGKSRIENAFAPDSSSHGYFLDGTTFKNLEVRINGTVYEGRASLNRGAISKPDFAAGDELELELGSDWVLHSGDSISVVYTPTGDTLQRVTVI